MRLEYEPSIQDTPEHGMIVGIAEHDGERGVVISFRPKGGEPKVVVMDPEDAREVAMALISFANTLSAPNN